MSRTSVLLNTAKNTDDREQAPWQKTPPKSGQPWSAADVKELKREIKENTPTRLKAFHLGRSEIAVQEKANALGLSTKPVNQSPNKKLKRNGERNPPSLAHALRDVGADGHRPPPTDEWAEPSA